MSFHAFNDNCVILEKTNMVFESDHFTLILAILLSGEFSNVNAILAGVCCVAFTYLGFLLGKCTAQSDVT